jgi:probable phosphomutase (TIGR03848 family)
MAPGRWSPGRFLLGQSSLWKPDLAEEPTRILLIRHASNDYIATGRLAGRTPGVHLNDRGRAEAQAVAERLAAVPLAAVYSSPLERALETAGPLADRHGVLPQLLAGVVETDCGEWTGASIEELSRTDLWRLMQASPSCARHPGGESMAEVQARMVAAVEELRILHTGQRIAVISHSDPIKLVLAFHTGLHIDMFQRLTVDPASINELEFSSRSPRLVRSNDRAHLQVDALGEK